MANMEPDAGDRASIERGAPRASLLVGPANGGDGTAALTSKAEAVAVEPAAHLPASDEPDESKTDDISFGDDGSEDAPAPGVVLIEPALLRRAVGSAFFDVPEEAVETTSPEDEQRRRYLRRYADAPGGLFRRHLIAGAGTLARLAALRAEVPNAATVVDVVERACQLSWHTASPLRLPPLLLVGPPGTGKSRVARCISEVLGTTMTVIDGGCTTDRGPIVGHDPGYRGSAPGKIATSLLDGSTSGPMMLIDEADKISAYSPGVRPLDALLPLLDPSTARSFTDTYLGVPLRADGVLWLLTANCIDGLPAPLLDRVVVTEMLPLGRAETREVIRRIFNEILAEHGLPIRDLSDAALRHLEGSGLRGARRILALALGPALAAGRGAPDAAEIVTAAALVSRPGRKPHRRTESPTANRSPVGFVHFAPSAAETRKRPATSRP